ncbi:phosphopantetheine-binding protein [Flavobacterium sp.]|uniref:acyl carrier protein n=1 Tax=Flavobacterium sp. TaxID=239 RepID=UPI00333F079F
MKEQLLDKLAEILEVDQVSLSDELESFDEWDSLTALSIIALAHSDYNKKLTNDLIKEFKSINDLVSFILN